MLHSVTCKVRLTPGVYYVCFLSFSEVFPMQMEGVRLVVNKGLSNHFQVSKLTFPQKFSCKMYFCMSPLPV